MKTKEITPDAYAAWKECTVQNITKHIRKGKMEFLPGIIEVKKYSRFYTLLVPDNLSDYTPETIISINLKK